MEKPLLARRIAEFAVVGIATSGTVAVLIGFAGDWNWFADLFAQLRPQYCLWLALGLVAGLWMRLRLGILISTLGLILNALALAPHTRSWDEPKLLAQTGRTWTLATINLLQGNQKTELVSQYLHATRPDIVAFQEVSPRWAGELETLSDLYPYRFVQPSKDQFGLALFSREPAIAQSVHAVGNRVGDLATFGSWESDGRRFSIAGIHPDKPDERWKTVNRDVYLRQIAQWAERHQKAGEAVIILGDFNATPWSASLRAFTRHTGYRNANKGRIFSATWNVWQPHRLLIDHAFFSADWIIRESTIGPALGSDHRPLLVRATLPSSR